MSFDRSLTSFGQLLRVLRERAGLSQNALAAAAATDPGTVNRLESGKRAPVNRPLLDRISVALDLSVDDRERMLGLAGHIPDSVARLGPTDPDLLLLADILSDTSIPDDEKRDLRLGVRVMARRWRRPPAAVLVDGLSAAGQPAPTKPSVPPTDPDWGCWL